MNILQTMGYFEEPRNFLKVFFLILGNNTAFYAQTFKSSVFKRFPYIWIVFGDVASLWVFINFYFRYSIKILYHNFIQIYKYYRYLSQFIMHI